MSSHLVDTSDEENCIVAVTRFLSDLLDEGQVMLMAVFSARASLAIHDMHCFGDRCSGRAFRCRTLIVGLPYFM